MTDQFNQSNSALKGICRIMSAELVGNTDWNKKNNNNMQAFIACVYSRMNDCVTAQSDLFQQTERFAKILRELMCVFASFSFLLEARRSLWQRIENRTYILLRSRIYYRQSPLNVYKAVNIQSKHSRSSTARILAVPDDGHFPRYHWIGAFLRKVLTLKSALRPFDFRGRINQVKQNRFTHEVVSSALQIKFNCTWSLVWTHLLLPTRIISANLAKYSSRNSINKRV